MSYGVREVEKMLRLPRSTIRALIDAGFVSPARGPRNSWLFSFQDLIVLRTAQTLAAAKIPAKRMNRSLKELRKQLPETMPLSGLSIGAIGESIVVRDGIIENVGAGVHHRVEHGDGVVLRLVAWDVLVVHRYDDPLRHAPRVVDPLEHAVEVRLVRNDPPLDLVAQGELEIVVRRVAEAREMDLGVRIGR